MTKQVEKRFKILALFALNLGIWGDKMQDLADALDTNHPQALKALSFYEDKLIETLEV